MFAICNGCCRLGRNRYETCRLIMNLLNYFLHGFYSLVILADNVKEEAKISLGETADVE